METLCISSFVLIVGLFLEYFYFQPLVKSKNARAQLQERIHILMDVARNIFHFLSQLFKKLLDSLTQTLAYGLVLLVFIATFSLNFIFQYIDSNIGIIQSWAEIQISTTALVSGAFVAAYFSTTIILGKLESAPRKISRLVVTICVTVILVNIYAPDFLFINEEIIKQTLPKLTAITSALIWGAALLLLDEYKKRYEKIDDDIAFLKDIPQISASIENESLQLIKSIQQGWVSFIDDPWADDYVSSIRNCVPVKCNGYLLAIGYVTDSEALILDNVKNALEEDLRKFFEIPRLKLCFENIDKQQHRALINLLNELHNKDGVNDKKK